MTTDALGDRMKLYERMEAGRCLMPRLPVIARIDGRAFHSFTRGMDRPFDDTFAQSMIRTTLALVSETGACVGYTQSDEITLAWPDTPDWFGGRIQKMVSQLAAHATVHFNHVLPEPLRAKMPTFDARVWNVPDRTEGANVFLWREWDATKNSISMAASAYYSHKQLLGKNSRDKHEMLEAKGVVWGNYPTHFKRGTYVQRRTESVPFSTEELDRLPPKHEARHNPALLVTRSVVAERDLPALGSIINRAAVIFDGEKEILL